MNPILVVHDDPDGVRAVFERVTDVEVVYAATPAEVGPALAAARPEAVFSVKHSGFPGPAHRPAVDCESVRWIHVAGAGYEHFAPWDTDRITITNSAGVLSPYLAESVIGGVLALNAGLVRYRECQRRREWSPRPFSPLRGKTMLVIGVGHIGGWVATYAGALGMRVLGTRRSGEAHPAVDAMHPPAAIPELLGEADVVALHLPLTDATRHTLGARALASMKRGAILANAARGPVIDEAALVEALASGHLGGAYLDVFETEPLPPTSPLWAMDNVIVSPHASDNVHGWPAKFAELFVDNLARYRAGEPLVNVVAP